MERKNTFLIGAKRFVFAVTSLWVTAITAHVHADFLDFGLINNDGANLTFVDLNKPPTLNADPAIPDFFLPRGVASTYYGAGRTHRDDPSQLWSGTPTDVGLTITDIRLNGEAVVTGFEIALGETGAFDDIFVNSIPPTQRYGLRDTLLLADAARILDAQSATDVGDPNRASEHTHVYLQASGPGLWEVTFVLSDIAVAPIYGDSAPFTMGFTAVPEPGSLALGLLAATAGFAALRRRHRS